MTDNASRPIVSIILAAGNGTRMRSPHKHKVTYPVAGTPVIERAIRTYSSAGIERHIVVIGSLADQVRDAANQAGHGISFVLQREQLGTAHATRLATEALREEGYTGDILVVAGDKVLEPTAIARLIEVFHEQECSIAFLTGKAEDFPTAGRVLERDETVRIVETSDVALARLLKEYRDRTREEPLSASLAIEAAQRAFPTERKAAKALGGLWDGIAAGRSLDAAAIPEPDEAALAAQNASSVNLSVYLFRAVDLYDALAAGGTNNAQGEEYLTDAIGYLSDRGRRVQTVPVADACEVMAFNTPEELAAVRRHYGRFQNLPPVARRVAEEFVQRFGREPALIAHAPGRLNLMGRHIDHQGGAGNLIAIGRGTYLAAGPRDDRGFVLHSGDPRYPEREFRVPVSPDACDWLAYVNGAKVRELVDRQRGDWSLYVRAAVERLQAEAERPLCGMNIVVGGDIPIAAGLSSSSALVVAASEAVVALNDLSFTRERLVELCGDAEWFVGTRGGAGDHAAMILSREGQVTQVGYYPFRAVDSALMPEGYTFVVFHSGIAARKSAEAGAVFNQRVACYHIGRELLKQAFPDRAGRIVHLRDVTAEAMGLAYPDLLRALKGLPATISASEARARVPENVCRAHLQPGTAVEQAYPVRDVVIFGLAECARASRCLSLLQAGDVAAFGRWMNTSHNGDRVTPPLHYSDAAMDRWIAAAEAGDPGAALELQPGAYGCSIPAIDRMVDIALSVPGVLGAQLSGAGLGGCMMALVEDGALDALEEVMRVGYYRPEGIEPEIIRCRAEGGSGVVA